MPIKQWIYFLFFALTSLLTILFSVDGRAYPDFIGYGYNTCLVCHYNSHGYGPLTDYGRALFAQEIASRTFVPKSVSDETLGEYAGFIPGVETTPWFRAGIKYRGFWVKSQPGSGAETSRFFHMQRDLNLVAQTANQRTILAFTYSLLPKARDYYLKGEKTEAISREHYLRFYARRDLMVAIGLMDIAYGIRIADHMSVTRGEIGIGVDDQVHGVLTQYLQSNWDATIHVFGGNLLQEASFRRRGFSLQGEYEVFEKNRVGASYTMFTDDFIESQRVAFHDRWGLPRAAGSSLMVEVGLAANKNKLSGERELGTYGMIRGLIRLVRGFNLISQLERQQADSTSSSPAMYKWTFGLLTFPFQRTEVRLTSVQKKAFAPEPGAQDSDRWQLQGQVHVSW